MIELMVVIAIIAILLTILAPAMTAILRRAKLAVCSSRMETIGKAAVSYASDNTQSLPYRADGSSVMTRMGYSYQEDIRTKSYYSNSRPWYLLVVHDMAPPSAFVCPGDAEADGMVSDPGYYDFGMGKDGARPVSYSMQVVLSGQKAGVGYDSTNVQHCKPVTMLRSTALVIGADRTGLGKWTSSGSFWNMVADGTFNGSDIQASNSENHDRYGQNVLSLDAHVKYETGPLVGIDEDNIWTREGSSGGGTAFTQNRPKHDRDSVLK